MVEAAIYFPIAVICAMAVMALLLNLYSQTVTQAHLHVLLRAEAAAVGDRTQARLTDAYERDKYRKEAESTSFAIVKGGKQPWLCLEASRTNTYYGGRFTNPAGYETGYYARCYIVDETLAARAEGMLKEAADWTGR